MPVAVIPPLPLLVPKNPVEQAAGALAQRQAVAQQVISLALQVKTRGGSGGGGSEMGTHLSEGPPAHAQERRPRAVAARGSIARPGACSTWAVERPHVCALSRAHVCCSGVVAAPAPWLRA